MGGPRRTPAASNNIMMNQGTGGVISAALRELPTSCKPRRNTHGKQASVRAKARWFSGRWVRQGSSAPGLELRQMVAWTGLGA